MAKKKKSRPGILVRMPLEELHQVNRAAATECCPRENWCRRVIMKAVDQALPKTTRRPA